jgi:glycosyltransferase involved in cell wall biosynthesis
MISNLMSMISVFIINYNNASLLKRAIESVLNQKKIHRKDYEILVYDDNSTDNSEDILHEYKNNIDFYHLNKNQTEYGSYNQIAGLRKLLENCKGQIISLLDSDDYFHENKLHEIKKYFQKEINTDVIYNFSINIVNNKFIEQKKKIMLKFIVPWPKFFPQSCISLKKNYLDKNLNKIFFYKFPLVWFDFRLSYLFYRQNGSIKYLYKHLTYYQPSNISASSKFKFFTKMWFKRRIECYSFIKLINKKEKFKTNFSFEYFLYDFITAINEYYNNWKKKFFRQ